MKGLKRSSIDELAKKMPKIEQKEQRECWGKTWGFSFSGNCLGLVGTSNNIVVLTPEDFDEQLGNASGTWSIYYYISPGGCGYHFWEDDGMNFGLTGKFPSMLGDSGQEVRAGIVNHFLEGSTIEYYYCGTLRSANITQCTMNYGGGYGWMLEQISPAPPWGGGANYRLYFPPDGPGYEFDDVDSLTNTIRTMLQNQ